MTIYLEKCTQNKYENNNQAECNDELMQQKGSNLEHAIKLYSEVANSLVNREGENKADEYLNPYSNNMNQHLVPNFGVENEVNLSSSRKLSVTKMLSSEGPDEDKRSESEPKKKRSLFNSYRDITKKQAESIFSFKAAEQCDNFSFKVKFKLRKKRSNFSTRSD